MKKRIFRSILMTLLVLGTVSCGGSRSSHQTGDASVQTRFPALPTAPTAITDRAEADRYVANHYWNKYFSEYGDNPTDSTRILGVSEENMELAIGTFAVLLESRLSTADAQQAMKVFFDLMEAHKAENPSSMAYEKISDLVAKYFYDPNSPVRDEDLYLPFVKRLSLSGYTDPNMIPAYSYDASMCELNQKGTKAADFSFRDLGGKTGSLYNVKAEYTLLFFSNPGCMSCQEIIEDLTDDPHIGEIITSGRLAVVNIYIDDDIAYWKDYARTYPKNWINAYDHKGKIRNDVSYNVRAIPSLYILDEQKTVIMKDALQANAIQYLRSIK